jgi:pyruvate, orthophosphate dikinase
MDIVVIGRHSAQLQPASEIGAKAANLARMAASGIAVPPAFVLPVALCAAIVRGDHDARRELNDALRRGIGFLEEETGRRFGDRHAPLLVSVRSGAARSMPGMLDTVLDVGCTTDAIHGLIRSTGNPRFVWDCRRRFLESYADVVLDLGEAPFKAARAALIRAENIRDESELDSEALERLAGSYLELIEDTDGVVADNAFAQLKAAAQAVYRSWTSERAIKYRSLQHLEDLAGTAVTVQAMVYGNRGLRSGAGVAFSRDPSTGARQPVIDVLFDAQGEDIVSGKRTPEGEDAIRRLLPEAAANLLDTLARLEREFSDVQDIEFTIENGELWILQTRSAKRTPEAALRFAIDFAEEGLITRAEALQRVADLDFDTLSCNELKDAGEPIASGIGASVGVAAGRIAFDALSAEQLAASGEPVILVRPDTSTADIAGFALSSGIVTAAGGRTAHAALVARQLAKPCVVGCKAFEIDADGQRARIAGATIKQGDWLSIDGESGQIYLGRRNIVSRRPTEALARISAWRAQCGENYSAEANQTAAGALLAAS